MKTVATLALSCALLAACPLLAEPPATLPTPEQQKQLEDIKLKRNAELRAKSLQSQVAELKATYSKQRAAYDSAVESEAKYKQAVRADSGLADTAGLPVLIRDLQSQRETLLQEEAAAKGRRAGLETAISRTDKQAEARASDDPVVKELQAVIDARQVKLDRVRQLQKAAAVAQADVDEAQAELATARANAAAAQQRLTTGATEAVDSWNRELMNLNITGLERAARMDYINARLRELAVASDDAERAVRTEMLVQTRRQQMRQTLNTLSRYNLPNDPIFDDDSSK